uniref:Uncharacterized protein n=1 Tax=Rhizophora mucronata TaxID=61149 RepID=A0A2P2Q0F3_RHIMU
MHLCCFCLVRFRSYVFLSYKHQMLPWSIREVTYDQC